MSDLKLIFYQLTRPVSYLFIKHKDKYIYDWVVPSVTLAALSALSYFMSFQLIDMYRFLAGVSGFLSSLPGFFVAALAAIATFNRLDIDKPMAGENPPKVETLINTQYRDVELSRRRFLCMLFSFLAVQSIVLSVVGLIPESFGFYGDGKINVSGNVAYSFLAFYFFFAIQLLTATMHGMYYLGDRIHYG
ncbi:hypothetical protein FEI13_17275 [Halomonas urmiana]|uniref:Uncharacterized protein n=1 Tax=Halomonas urmiana TaxID=490901 RepID=A0A5R8M972_9GAMM|nr:hypothetical protein [Halomonas urmiana]TLF46040.1 hypothetical protein FEI13_17275 [Halomonas urmiana]